MIKTILCGTHPGQYNGYSKVVFELAKYLATCKDIELHIFGFQNFYDKKEHKIERQLPSNVEIYDVFQNEEPKNKGFGETLIVDYILERDPDIVIIYNDLIVINQLLEKIKTIPSRKFRIVPYIDIVYKNEKNNLIANINNICDSGIMFTQYWKDIIEFQGFTKPLHILEHGFNSKQFYPIPKNIARKYFSMNDDDFIIVNLNRNQPRKRWDICMMAYVKFISKHIGEKIKLLIATNMQGGWDLVDIMISECRKYNISTDDFKKHLIVLQNPQQISDFDINVLYNLSDIGINTCDGEGFGLCNFEQAGVGVPQIIPSVGGFKDFFNDTNSLIIDPKWTYYCDHSRDFVSGEAEICDINDYVSALEYYFTNKDVITKHGKAARDHIVTNYSWNDKGKQLEDIIRMETKHLETSSKSKININEIDINEIININNDTINDESSEEIEIIKGSNKNDVDIDNMNTDDMKKMLKDLLEKNKN